MSANKRFTDLKTNCGNEVRDTSSALATVIGVYLNNRYRDVINRLITADAFEVYNTFTLTTVANTSTYSMPYDFSGQIVYAVDTTNDRILDVISEQEQIQKYGSNLSTTGAPIVVIPKAESTVYSQPTASSTLKAVSTSGADTTQSVFLRGISGSAEYYETLAISGDTATATSTNSYDRVLSLIKDASTTGKVTITYTTGGAVASVISPESKEARFQLVELYYVPSGVYTISIRYRRDVKPMVSDNDTPVIDIADILEKGAIADTWRYKRQFANADIFETQYELLLDRYITQRQSGQVQQFSITPYDRNETYE